MATRKINLEKDVLKGTISLLVLEHASLGSIPFGFVVNHGDRVVGCSWRKDTASVLRLRGPIAEICDNLDAIFKDVEATRPKEVPFFDHLKSYFAFGSIRLSVKTQYESSFKAAWESQIATIRNEIDLGFAEVGTKLSGIQDQICETTDVWAVSEQFAFAA